MPPNNGTKAVPLQLTLSSLNNLGRLMGIVDIFLLAANQHQVDAQNHHDACQCSFWTLDWDGGRELHSQRRLLLISGKTPEKGHFFLVSSHMIVSNAQVCRNVPTKFCHSPSWQRDGPSLISYQWVDFDASTTARCACRFLVLHFTLAEGRCLAVNHRPVVHQTMIPAPLRVIPAVWFRDIKDCARL